jgi:hypothetical protein
MTNAIFPTPFFFSMQESPKIVFSIPKKPCLRKRKQNNLARSCRTEITPVLPITGQKFPRYFEKYLAFFAVCQNFYFFIYSTNFRGTLAGKHCADVTQSVPLQKFKWSLTGFFEVAFTKNTLLTLAMVLNSGTGNDNVRTWRPYDWLKLLRTFFSTNKDVLNDDVTHGD